MTDSVEPPAGPVTAWLVRLRAGDQRALEPVMRLLYDELRAQARRHIRREGRDHTLSPTALVHEVYLKLLRQRQIAAGDRGEFVAIAGQVMRRILVDYARSRKRIKHGGDLTPASMEEAEVEVEAQSFLSMKEADEILALDAALSRLAELDPRASQVVQCRFYAGLTLDETAAAMSLSPKTVHRTWTTARAWLRKEIGA